MLAATDPDLRKIVVVQMEEATQLVRGRRRRITAVVFTLCRGEKADGHRRTGMVFSLNRARSSDGRAEPLKVLSLK